MEADTDIDLEAQMANVPVAAPTKDPVVQSEVLVGSLRDAGMKSLDHCKSSFPCTSFPSTKLIPFKMLENYHHGDIESANHSYP